MARARRLASVGAVLMVLAVPGTAWGQADLSPPQTTITATPSNPTAERSATFGFSGSDDTTPPDELEFECRFDTVDENLWLECLSPQFFQGLLTGPHTFEVRALDADENIDPTPASYTWTVLPPATCAEASATVPAVADSWINQSSPLDNKGDDGSLIVQSKSPSSNTRALVRFALPATPAGCAVASATLRLYSDKAAEFPRTLHAYQLGSAWGENNVSWANQPATIGGPAAASSASNPLSWDVAAQLSAIYSGAANHGFVIRDAAEDDIAGPETKLISREQGETPPELQLVFANRSGGGSAPGGNFTPGSNAVPGRGGPAPSPRARVRMLGSLRSDLRAVARALRRLGIAGLLRRGGVSVRNVNAEAAGTVRVDALATVAGGSNAAGRVVVVRGRRGFAHRGAGTLRLRLTSRARRLLADRRNLQLRLRGSFTTEAGHRIRASRSVTLARGGRR